jgi:hypothetical protein
VRGSCALTQDSMSLLGHVFDLHARHAVSGRGGSASASAVAAAAAPDLAASGPAAGEACAQLVRATAR